MVRHLGIIMDGNRRFSQRLLKEPWRGHEWGQKKLQEVLGWTRSAGIQEVTLYAFSLQNFSRPQEEFDQLMKLFVEACDELLARPKKVVGEGVRIYFIGEIDRFPETVSSRMREVEELTRRNTSYRLNLCMAYGGREEIVAGVKRIAQRVSSGELSADDVDMDVVSSSLQLASEPDLVIRTGGERRTSNFLLWQTWYSEWCFVDSLWPEFSREEFFGCLEEYAARTRRFGR